MRNLVAPEERRCYLLLKPKGPVLKPVLLQPQHAKYRSVDLKHAVPFLEGFLVQGLTQKPPFPSRVLRDAVDGGDVAPLRQRDSTWKPHITPLQCGGSC